MLCLLLQYWLPNFLTNKYFKIKVLGQYYQKEIRFSSQKNGFIQKHFSWKGISTPFSVLRELALNIQGRACISGRERNQQICNNNMCGSRMPVTSTRRRCLPACACCLLWLAMWNRLRPDTGNITSVSDNGMQLYVSHVQRIAVINFLLTQLSTVIRLNDYPAIPKKGESATSNIFDTRHETLFIINSELM